LICLKSWGVFINKEKEIKREENKDKKDKEEVSKEDNQFFIPDLD
jgi:hypothetical protein